MRAHVRDIKSYSRLRGGRQVLVGVSLHPNAIGLSAVQYFSAGPSSDESRADLIAVGNYSWSKHSSFQISGWKDQVKVLQQYPVPMFLGEYGTVVDYRLWEEVDCLYSRDITSVFSGGCPCTCYEHGNKHGIVKEDGQGWLYRKPDSNLLRRGFQTVNSRVPEELFDARVKIYESWTGDYPERDEHRWFATSASPDCPLDLAKLLSKLEEEREWEVGGGKVEDLTL
ncbi:glycoside hydrolase family 72 protein [Dothistroma septosporum NZE10]|uniref:1,3-beta-glucanosyltransferase n=1 Tax=Dothistroma septosporum (strain NZE10 / CBS 128990) TaxID=675120 RepID=M2YMV2_DOTSN|nr:glycoside hydrolase family 72 protein [Dothistroma septosporum NZE10]